MIMKYVQNNIFTLNKWQKTKSLPLVVYHIDRGTHVADDFHSHNFMEIAFIRGSGRHVLEHLEVPLAEGDVLVVPPGLPMLMRIVRIWKFSICCMTPVRF